MARELASREITVNAIAPGFITTDMTQALPEGARKEFAERIPLGRFGARRRLRSWRCSLHPTRRRT